MGKVMVIDVAECIGCYLCQLACKDEHVGNDWSPYAKPQPEVGHFWMKLNDMERGGGSFTRVSYVPTLCAHCENAPCMNVCPVNAIYRSDDGAVIIDPEKCNGCADYGYEPLCQRACPYGAIYFNEELKIAQKCTFCEHLLKSGWKQPRCADVCPTDAIKFGDEDDPEMRKLMEGAEPLHPEVDVKPRVLYRNLPRPYIAGTIIDPAAREVVEGASVTAIDVVSRKEYRTLTDEFGDFWLRGLEWNHKYLVKVEKDGYSPRVLGVLSTEKDVVLERVELHRKA
ncbi:MAG: 4Fe-4S dicluster domain-containing protein [Nitrososphaeria archaeon]|jgi:Fe-S-cluster-containing hydrogenase components 1